MSHHYVAVDDGSGVGDDTDDSSRTASVFLPAPLVGQGPAPPRPAYSLSLSPSLASAPESGGPAADDGGGGGGGYSGIGVGGGSEFGGFGGERPPTPGGGGGGGEAPTRVVTATLDLTDLERERAEADRSWVREATDFAKYLFAGEHAWDARSRGETYLPVHDSATGTERLELGPIDPSLVMPSQRRFARYAAAKKRLRVVLRGLLPAVLVGGAVTSYVVFSLTVAAPKVLEGSLFGALQLMTANVLMLMWLWAFVATARAHCPQATAEEIAVERQQLTGADGTVVHTAHDAFLEAVEQQVETYCTKCAAPKLRRTHHCTWCKRCVPAMDHHCWWIGTCIGAHNRKYFLLVLLWSTVVCLFGNVSIALSVKHTLAASVLLYLALTSFCGMLMFGSFHVYLTLRNLTTIEFVALLSKRFASPETSGSRVPTNPWDRGSWQNWVDVFGDDPKLWLLPIRSW